MPTLLGNEESKDKKLYVTVETQKMGRSTTENLKNFTVLELPIQP